MENEVTQTQAVDLWHLVAWFHANRNRVLPITAIILVIGAGIGGFIWHKNYVETQAAAALSNIKPPTSAQESGAPNAANALPYVKVADDYAGTRGAARALLIAGGIQFDAGKFDVSQATFRRFISEYSENPLANLALLGVAASLEAQGKTAEAATAYDDLIKRHQADSTTPQAKSALARLYVAQDKPEQAMHLYEELARANNNDTWSVEAGIQLQELLAKYPNLKKPVASAPVPTAPMLK
jgi:predicted negative regulator of RcsB-dependent stress response